MPLLENLERVTTFSPNPLEVAHVSTTSDKLLLSNTQENQERGMAFPGSAHSRAQHCSPLHHPT